MKTFGMQKVQLLNGNYSDYIKDSSSKNIIYNRKNQTIEQLPKEEYIPKESPLITIDEIIEILQKKDQGVQFIDSRDEDSFAEDPKPPRKFGHIPGAINFCAYEAIREDTGILKKESEILEIIKDKKIDLTKQLIVYCNRGIMASFNYTLFKALGANAKLYSNSWAEYSEDKRTLGFEKEN